jgi:hypothetical protein
MMNDESGEMDDIEVINPFEDECEEGEVDMDDYGEEGEMEVMELAEGESQSDSDSDDSGAQELEAIKEILADKNKMKMIAKEAKALGMTDMKDDESEESESDSESEIENKPIAIQKD